ncbi:proline dehydrogenase family protein [Pantoea sp. At-9b]|uniref:proline dehydrogenase family protein n=1 Tax=Pantoea sp. (strain At-9b) TaxID=592316 RepID=UPI0001F25FF4|nr:proline dehydrogenase family protein [Pantoea sp. At-9b]ADU71471.1 Proline dehydrogenase [Pantoea sp. At-9b]
MKYDLLNIYKRYSTKELSFKLMATTLLSNKFTRIPSIYLVKKCLSQKKGSVFRATNNIYFSGETIHEATTACENLARTGVYGILDYAVEGESDEFHFETAINHTLQLIDLAHRSENMPFVVVKPTALGSSGVYEKVSKNLINSDEEKEDWQKIINRFYTIFDCASSRGVSVMVDAEQTTVQPAVDELMLLMMKKYNHHYPAIILTMQFYLKGKFNTLKEYYHLACNNDFILGIKVVRGAYLEEEKKLDRENLFFECKKDTDDSYNACIDYVSQRLERIHPFFATHNDESIQRIISNQNLSDARVWIGQLYGLGDHLTYSIKTMGFRVCKYLPYGPQKKSLPYLLRRIEENAIATQTFKKESKLLFRELCNRLLWRRND